MSIIFWCIYTAVTLVAIVFLGLQEFHYNNFEDIFDIPLEEIAKNGTPRIVCTSCRSVIEEYLTSHQHLDHQVGERLVIL